jgi:hypothetical protein
MSELISFALGALCALAFVVVMRAKHATVPNGVRQYWQVIKNVVTGL